MATDAHRFEKGHESAAVLWIDGVGSWLLWFLPEFSLGGGGQENRQVDLPIMANLSRRHLVLRRLDDLYQVMPVGTVSIDGEALAGNRWLAAHESLLLGTDVQLEFVRPNALSGSAVLRFASHHRPLERVEGVVLMEENCLLGPGQGVHIPCVDWPQPIAFFRREGHLWCRADPSVQIDGVPVTRSMPVGTGSTVSGKNWRLSVAAWTRAGESRRGL